MNPFNRSNDSGHSRQPFMDMSGEKTPMREVMEDDELNEKGLGPNEGAPVNGTLTEDETESPDAVSLVPPGGRNIGDYGEGAGDNMQYSFESGRMYKGKESKGKVVKSAQHTQKLYG